MDRIAALARRINDLTADLARDTARQIKNVWICEDGKVTVIEDPAMLRAKISDDQKKLSDMLRLFDEAIEERNEVSNAVQDTAERRDSMQGDAVKAESV